MKKIPPFRNRRDSRQSSTKRITSLPRFSLKNFSIALLVNAGLMHMSLYGSVPLTTFESPIAPSTNLSSVSSDWTVANGQAIVEPGVGFQGSQGVKITQGLDQETRITRAITWNSSEQTAFIDFRIKPAANEQGSSAAIAVNGTQIGIQKNAEDATKGDIWVLNGTDPKWISAPSNLDAGLNLTQWLLTYGMFSLNTAQTAATDYMRITLRQDYERKVWDLYVDGKLTAADLRFEKQGVLNALHIYGSTEGDVLLDDLQAIPTNMLFADADKDGIPDSVEIANGSNPNVKDREALDPATGKTYLQKYLEQLWPNNSPSGTGAYVAPSGSIPPLTLPEHTPVGALKGNFSVGGDGSATYSVPIDLPKGTSGMEPQLSLGYSSNGGNSICGLGFGLSGLQSITRGPSSLKKDGFIDGVDFDEKDRFFLNGERLVCVSGLYGADGSEYRTEMDSYSRIKLTGNANSGQASFWTVQTKAGLTIQFGNTKGSKVTCSNATAPMAWAVNRVTDAVGNYYKVLYAEGTSDAAIPDDSSINYTNSSINSHRVAKISYTGNDSASLSPYIDVNFTYEDRTDTNFAYTFGVKSESTKRLKSIAVKTENYLNHTYQFLYVNSAQTNRSLLQIISKNVNGASVPLATTFHWDAHLGSLPTSMWEQEGMVPVFLAYDSGQNNDGRIVSHAGVEDGGTTVHLTGNAWRYRTLPSAYQVTANTLLTFDYKVSGIASEQICIGLDNNLSADSTRIFQVAGNEASAFNRTWHHKSWTPLESGLPPFIQTDPPTNPPTVYQSTVFPSANSIAAPADHWVRVTIPIGTRFTGACNHLVFINDDDNSSNGVGECWFRNLKIYESTTNNPESIVFPQVNWELPMLMQSDWIDSGFQFIDVNLDGVVDLVRNDVDSASDWKLNNFAQPANAAKLFTQTYLNNGYGFVSAPATWHSPAILSSHDNDATDSYLAYMGVTANFSDYNSDGRPDIMRRFFANATDEANGTVSFEAFLHTGAGWQASSSHSYPFQTLKQTGYGMSTNPRFRDWQETDLNGDGYVDLIANTKRGFLNFGANDPRNIFDLAYKVLLHNGSSTTPGWIDNTDYKLPDPGEAVYGQQYTPFLKDGADEDDIGRGLIDINGDGLPDFYCAHPELKKTYLNHGSGWNKNTLHTPNHPAYCHQGNFAAMLPQAIVNTSGKSLGCRLIDLNGDGLPDFLRSQSYYVSFPETKIENAGPRATYINTGDTTSSNSSAMFQQLVDATYTSSSQLPAHSWTLPYALERAWSGNDNLGNELTDINGDGLVDAVYSNHLVNGAYLNTGTTFTSLSTAYAFPDDVRFCNDGSQIDNKRRDAMLVDLNGDGFPDLLGNIYNATPQIYINKSKTEKINKVVDSFGSDIQIEYTRLNDPTVKPAFDSRVYQKNFGTLPAGQIGVIDSRLVVSRYSAPTYLSAPNDRRYTSHRYGDLRYDRNNETSLGFGWAEVQDELTQQITRTEYRQDFPFAGSPSVTHTSVLITENDISTAESAGSEIFEGTTAGWKCLTKETADYGQIPLEVGLEGKKIYRPVQISAIKEQYDLKRSASATSPEPCGDLKSQTITTQPLSEYDNYGFLKNSTVTSLDGTVIATSSIYNHTVDNTKWHLGRLQASAVVKSKIGQNPITKSSNFTYLANGLLSTETIEPGNAALTVTKTYNYDTRGNITGIAITGKNAQGVSETRTSGTAYDSKGRFVTAETNQLGHSVLYQYDEARALLKKTTDINGLATHFRYDPYGTLTLTLHPDGTRTGEATGNVYGNVLPPNVAPSNIIKYYRAKQTSGGPVAYAYFDAAGREILSRSTTLINATASGEARYATIYSHNKYDAFGRNTHTSLPFAANETPMYTVRLIDILGRTYCTQHPNGSVDKVDCYGVATLNGQPVTYSCATAANGQTLERWEDQHGRMIQSRDESGLITAFNHDLEGRLTSVKMENTPNSDPSPSNVLAPGDHTLLLTNTFDIVGNKISVWEINSGTSYSTYSAFGEVKSSTNARQQTTSYTYDLLGRPLTIHRPEGTFTNEYYDTVVGTASKGKPSKITGPDNYEETIMYDSLGRPTSTSKTQFGGNTYYTFTSYDALGRVKTSTDAGGLTTCTHYDERYSIPVKIVLASPPPGMTALPGVGTVLWEAGTFDARGNALTQKLGNGVNISQAYQASTGNLTGLAATQNGTTVQNKAYTWDTAGNLTSRTNLAVNGTADTLTESFGYDALNRLTSRTIGNTTQAYTYDVKGNLLSKPGAALTYANGKPHQVSTATVKGVTRNYTYDAAGYLTSDSKRDYFWSSFGQLKDLIYTAAPPLHDLSGTMLELGADVRSQFFFDAAGNRARQWKTRTSTGSYKTEETLYLGSYEREIHSISAHPSITPTEYKRVHRHSLGDMIYTRTTTPSTGETVRLTTKLDDHLGSTDVLITSKWQNNTFAHESTEYQAFDPWGERANVATAVPFRQADADPFRRSAQDYDRGYTGHEQLDDSGIIHMNGRLYDAELGRMLSADPYVQVPEYSQNFNRYSYVLNNPLNKTDPTGYSWLSKAFHKIGAWVKENWRTIVSIVLAVAFFFIAPVLVGAVLSATGAVFTPLVTQAIIGATAGFLSGAANAAIAGGDLGDVLRGGLVGAVQGAISSGPLHSMQGAATVGGKLAHVVGHGVTGGAANEAMGGKFQDGFLSAAAGAAATHTGLYGKFQGSGIDKVAGRTAVAAVIGGTASALGGGKFGNGAWTAAFQHLLNYEAEIIYDRIAYNQDVGDEVSGVRIGYPFARTLDEYSTEAEIAAIETGLFMMNFVPLPKIPAANRLIIRIGEGISSFASIGAAKMFARNLVRIPHRIWGKSAVDIADSLALAGYETVVKQSTKGSKLATIIKVIGHKEIQQIQFHPGGGRHVGSYYKISTSTEGVIRVADSRTFVPGSAGGKIVYVDQIH